MDFGEIWEEHKKFIVAVGAALVVFFIGTRVVNSMYVNPAKRLDSSADRLERKLRRGVAPKRGDLNDARDLGKDADVKLGEIERRIAHEIDSRFILPAGADFDLVYNDRYREARDQLVQRAGIEDVDLDPSVGMPDSTPDDREDVIRHLKALDQILVVVGSAMDNGVAGIPQIRVLAEGRKGFLASQAYLVRTRVEYEMYGNADALVGVIESLQSGDSFLGIGDCRVDLDPKEVDVVRMVLEVVTFETNPEAPAMLSAEKESRRKKR